MSHKIDYPQPRIAVPLCVADIVLILLFVFTPLALGAVHLWSIGVFCSCAAFLFALFFFRYPDLLKAFFRLPIAWLGVVFLAMAALQLIPVPPAILRVLSPATYAVYERYAFDYPASGMRGMSVYPWATVFEILRFIAYGCIFAFVTQRIAVNRQKEPEGVYAYMRIMCAYLALGCMTGVLAIVIHNLVDFNSHITDNAFHFTVLLALAMAFVLQAGKPLDYRCVLRYVNAIIIVGFAGAVFGIIYKFEGAPSMVYWVIAKDKGVFGTYINYDHYAGYMSMCASLSIAAFIGHLRLSSFVEQKGWRRKALWCASGDANRILWYLFCSLVMIGSIFLSTSRGGILSFLIALALFFAVILTRMHRSRRRHVIIALVSIVVLVVLLNIWIGPEEWLDKVYKLNRIVRSIIKEPAVLSELRPVIWADTLRLIRDFPVFGTGLGTYCHIYPMYRSFVPGDLFLRYAHNDYLQIMAEMGALGLCIAAVFIAAVVALYKKVTHEIM